MKELGLDVGLLISQAANFGLLLALLYFLLYKPLLHKLEERAERIKKGVDDAEQAKELLAETEVHYKGEVDRARREAHEIIDRATRSAEQQRQEILAQARQEAHEMILRAQQQAERETLERQIALRQQVIDLAISAASRLIHEELDEERHHQLIQEFLTNIGDLE